jgi:protein-S-isoprenylcysteine O-methyltransferase Ste14
MRTRTAAIGTVAFAATVPATVAGVIPRWLAGDARNARSPHALGRIVGASLVVAGLPLVADAFVRFVRAHGTPSPTAETEELVTSGPYGISRNPQYVGVVATVAGQGLWWGSRRVLLYAVWLAVVFDTWVRIYEEPRLRRRFGPAYDRYTRTVPRWVGPARPPARSNLSRPLAGRTSMLQDGQVGPPDDQRRRCDQQHR